MLVHKLWGCLCLLLPPNAEPPMGPGSWVRKTGRQQALMLLLHHGFIGFPLMGLSLSQEEAGWEGSHKTKASHLTNAAPGGKGHRSSSCSWSRRTELAFHSLARTGSLLAGRGNVGAAPSAIHHSGPTHAGVTEVPNPEGGC